MGSLLFVPGMLRTIGRGDLFRSIVSIVLYVVALLVAILSLVGLVGAAGLAFELHGAAVGLFFGVILLVASYAAVHTIWIRAGTVRDGPGGDYVVTPIAAVLMRLLGELYAVFAGILSVGGALLALFGVRLARLTSDFAIGIPGSGSGTGIAGAAMILAWGWVSAFVALIVAYFVAESILVLADIAGSVKATRRIAEDLTARSMPSP